MTTNIKKSFCETTLAKMPPKGSKTGGEGGEDLEQVELAKQQDEAEDLRQRVEDHLLVR